MTKQKNLKHNSWVHGVGTKVAKTKYNELKSKFEHLKN